MVIYANEVETKENKIAWGKKNNYNIYNRIQCLKAMYC